MFCCTLSFVLHLFGTTQYTCTISVFYISSTPFEPIPAQPMTRGIGDTLAFLLCSKHLEVLAGTGFAVLVSAESAMAPDGSGETRCGISERIGHAHSQCTAVVILVAAPNPPLPVYFDAGLLPPHYHCTDNSRVLHRVGIPTTAELGNRAATASAAAAVWPTTTMDRPGATTTAAAV